MRIIQGYPDVIFVDEAYECRNSKNELISIEYANASVDKIKLAETIRRKQEAEPIVGSKRIRIATYKLVNIEEVDIKTELTTERCIYSA